MKQIGLKDEVYDKLVDIVSEEIKTRRHSFSFGDAVDMLIGFYRNTQKPAGAAQ